jgi:hypothetical protein
MSRARHGDINVEIVNITLHINTHTRFRIKNSDLKPISLDSMSSAKHNRVDSNIMSSLMGGYAGTSGDPR